MNVRIGASLIAGTLLPLTTLSRSVSAIENGQHLRLSVAVAPVISTASDERDRAGNDLDGYRQLSAHPGPEGGASKLLVRWLADSKQVVALREDERPPQQVAPVELQAAILTFEHRPTEVGSGSGRFEAFVELGVRLVQTSSGHELFRGVFQGSAPARGALVPGVRNEIFRRGLAGYLDRPLGRAFQQAARTALMGSSGEGRAVLPFLAGMQWEAGVIQPAGKGYRINAGSANGLSVGDVLTPFADRQASVDETPDRVWTGGILKVQGDGLTANEAVVAPDRGEEEPPGAKAQVVAFGRVPEAFVGRGSITRADRGIPAVFKDRLAEWLHTLEERLGWPEDAGVITATLRLLDVQEETCHVEVTFYDRKRNGLHTWRGDVPRKDAGTAVRTCMADSERALIGHISQDSAQGPEVRGDTVHTEFRRVLQTDMANLLERLRGAWISESLGMTAKVKLEGGAQRVEVTLEDRRASKPRELAKWSGSVPADDVTARNDALECFDRFRIALRAPGTQQVAAKSHGKSSSELAALHSGDARARLEGTGSAVRLRLDLANRKLPRSFQQGDPLEFRLRSSKRCWVLVYGVTTNGELTQVWPEAPNEFMPQEVRPAEPVHFSYPTSAPLGRELLVAVASTDQEHQPKPVSADAGIAGLLRLEQEQLLVATTKNAHVRTTLADPAAIEISKRTDLVRQAVEDAQRRDAYAVAFLEFRTGD